MVEERYEQLTPIQLNGQLALIIDKYVRGQKFQAIDVVTPSEIVERQIQEEGVALTQVTMRSPADYEPPNSVEIPRIPRDVVNSKKAEQVQRELDELINNAPHLTSIGREIIVGDIIHYLRSYFDGELQVGSSYLSRRPSGGGLFDQREATELETEAFQNFQRIIEVLSSPKNRNAPLWWRPLGYQREDAPILQQYLQQWRTELLLNYEMEA